jgi:hypothetical protein
VHSFQVCITSTSIPASLRCTCFVIARQILSTPCRHSGQTPHRPRRTLRPTDRNRDPHFTSSFFRELCRVTGAVQNLSTAYRPQTDGQSERTNQCLEQYIRIFTVFKQDNWADLLALAQYVLNSWPNATTKKAPYELLLGYIPCIHQTVQISNNPGLEERLQRLATAREEAAEALCRATNVQVPSKFEPYQIGNKVWLEGRNLTTTHPSAKLAPRRCGPFPITCVISCTSYQLKLPFQWKVHNVFHTTLLTPYKETPLNGKQYQEPIPELIDGQPEWEVEDILCVRRRRNQLQYLVRWKGFSEAHDSWEPAKDVHAENLIEEFYKRHPTAIQTISSQPLTNIVIRSSTMTSTPNSPSLPSIPLSERIENVPFPLPLAERIDTSIPPPELPSTPLPSEELHYPPMITAGMVTPTFSEESSFTEQPKHDAAKPEDYAIYNRHLENHIKYGEKIHLPTGDYKYPHYIRFDHDYVDHRHHVFATHKDVEGMPYGWTLEAAPFMGPKPSPLVTDSDHLAPFTNAYHFKKEVDIALYTIDDPGLIADVDRHRALEEEERQLAHRRRELENDAFNLNQKIEPIHQCLRNTQAYPRVHPYLSGKEKVPFPGLSRPAYFRDYPLSMREALTIDTTSADVTWLPRPWYHEEGQAGSTPMTISHCSICLYCNDLNHVPTQCPDPHHLCPDRLSCIIPSYHTNFGDHCPADPRRHLLDYLLDAISEGNRDLDEGEVPY